MEKLLPIPTIEHIPPYDRAEPLCNKMDKIFSEIQEEIIELKHIVDPFACKSAVLDVFGKMVDANMRKTDSEDTKRHRIYTAIEDNKLFGTWFRVKRLIDDICHGDAKLIFQEPDDAWILCGSAQMQEISRPTWACLGLNQQSAQDNKYGIALDGKPIVWQKGVFYIDVDNDHLTTEEVTMLHEDLYSSTPVGMTIGVGYIDDTEFIPYFTLGEIL